MCHLCSKGAVRSNPSNRVGFWIAAVKAIRPPMLWPIRKRGRPG